MLATGKNELTAPANTIAQPYAGHDAGSSTHPTPVAATTRPVVRTLAIGPTRSVPAPETSLAAMETTRPTASSAAAVPARRPHSETANVVKNGIAPYWHTAPTAPMAVGKPNTARTGKRTDTAAPDGGPSRTLHVAT